MTVVRLEQSNHGPARRQRHSRDGLNASVVNADMSTTDVVDDPAARLINVRFSNRPFRVKHFQIVHLCGVDVARRLALLFGIGTRALPSWDSKIRWNL